jgi:hypothetical protein
LGITFDSISRLLDDPGPIGISLNEFPETRLLRDADTWPNPWKFLLGCTDNPPRFQRLFAAGDSQRIAAYRIAEMAIGAGSIETSLEQQIRSAMKDGNTKPLNAATEKLLAVLWKYDRGEKLLKGKNLSPVLSAELKARMEKLSENHCRRLGRKKVDALRRQAVFNCRTITGKIAWRMVTGWLRNGEGGAGYCFFSDEALRAFLESRIFPDLWRRRNSTSLRDLPKGQHISGLPFETVRQTRQFLQLRKAPTLIYRVRQMGDGSLHLLNRVGDLMQRFRP